MRRVEITEEILNDAASTYYKGDVITVDPVKYDIWVNQMGWAKDAETGEQAERVPGAHKIKVDNVAQSIK